MITYSLHDSGVFHVNFSEKVTFDDLEKYLEEFKNLDIIPKKLLSLYDLRGTEMPLLSEDLKILSGLAVIATSPLQIVKTAFLVDQPQLTALALLFSVDHDQERITRQVFTSEEAALDWLTADV